MKYSLLDPATLPPDYYGNDAHLTTMWNALSVLFPEGERFFVDSVRRFRGRIEDPALLAEITAFIGQEAMHSKEHAALSQVGDICSAADCASAMRGVDAVIHLAALYRDDVRPRERYYQVNVNGTQRLIEAAVAHDLELAVQLAAFGDATACGRDGCGEQGRLEESAEHMLESG